MNPDVEPEVVRRLITRADFARMNGVSRAAVTQAVSTGRLNGAALGPSKKLVLPFAAQQWTGNKIGDAGVDIARRECWVAEPSSDAQQNGAADLVPQSGTLAYERHRAQQLRNQRLEAALASDLAQMVPRAEVAIAMHSCAALIDGALENILDWAERFVVASEAGGVRALLKTLAREKRKEIATMLAAAAAAGFQGDPP